MALLSYDDLLASVAGWLNRSDLTARIPDFVTTAEDTIAGDVMPPLRRAELVVEERVTDLPADFDGLEGLSVTSPVGYRPPKKVTAAEFYEQEVNYLGVTGSPDFVTIIDDKLLVCPAPNQEYTFELAYLEKLPQLGNDNATNSVMREAPSVYLYGTLIAAAPYLKNDVRVPLWQGLYDRAVAALNKRRNQRKNPTGMSGRLPAVFG
jgi:hypothetical protein